MIYTNASDLELWQYCQQDDMRAYNELFDRYAAKLYKQAARYVRNTMDAEELVMDLLHSIWQKREHLQPSSIKAYLTQAMRNRVINYLQKNIPELNSIDSLPEDMLVESRQADYFMISKDLDTIYRTGLNELSPQRLKVFKLSREENMTYAEIAKKMNLSVNTVENYMVAALSALRESTKEYPPLISLLAFFFLQ